MRRKYRNKFVPTSPIEFLDIHITSLEIDAYDMVMSYNDY